MNKLNFKEIWRSCWFIKIFNFFKGKDKDKCILCDNKVDKENSDMYCFHHYYLKELKGGNIK